MKPWLKAICDQVEDGTALPARIDDALAVFRRWGFDEDAPLFTMAGELVAMLIERCEQQEAELARLKTEIAGYAAEALHDAMSELSEDCYAAGWMQGLEYDLWRIVLAGDGHYGMGRITRDDTARLRQLADDAGGWWMHGELVSMSEWLKRYEEREAEKARMQ